MSDYKKKFKEEYGGTFSRIYNFMEQFHGTTSDEEWEACADGLKSLNSNLKFECHLSVIVTAELERAYTGGISKTQGDFKSIYHSVFERNYRFAYLLYVYYQSPSSERWRTIAEEMATIEDATVFEREMARICLSKFMTPFWAEDQVYCDVA
jgi:hypothetical protein